MVLGITVFKHFIIRLTCLKFGTPSIITFQFGITGNLDVPILKHLTVNIDSCFLLDCVINAYTIISVIASSVTTIDTENIGVELPEPRSDSTTLFTNQEAV